MSRSGVGWRQWRAAEKGASTLTLFILALPVILLAFGYGFDSVRLTYLRNFLESRAEIAATAGASVTHTADRADPQGTPVVGSTVIIGAYGDSTAGESALARAYSNYMQNTESKRDDRILTCTQLAPDFRYPDTNPAPGPEIDWRLKNFMANNPDKCLFATQVVGNPIPGEELCSSQVDGRPEYGVTVGVNERVALTFLKIFNIDDTWVNDIRGTALIRASDNC